MKKIIFFVLSCICAVCAVVFCGKAIDRGNDPIIYGVEYKRTSLEQEVYSREYYNKTETVEFYKNGQLKLTIEYDYTNPTDSPKRPTYEVIYCDYSLAKSPSEIWMVFFTTPGLISDYYNFGESQRVLQFSENAKECWLYREEEFVYKADSNPELINWILFGLFTAVTVATATLTVLAIKKAKKKD